MAAYAFSWLDFPGRDTIFLLVVALLLVPVQVAFIPLLTLFRPFGLTDGYGAVWLAHTAFALPFGIFLLRNFFITLPTRPHRGGADRRGREVGIFRTIVVPLSVPAIAALRDLPVPVGLERPADGPGLRRRTPRSSR